MPGNVQGYPESRADARWTRRPGYTACVWKVTVSRVSYLVLLLPLAPAALLTGCRSDNEDTARAGAQPPVITLTAPAFGSSWSSGSPIPVQATFSDDLDSPGALSVTISSDLDGLLAAPELGADGVLDTTVVLDAGTHALTLSATDSGGHTGTAVATIRVVEGTYPTQPALRIDPTDPVTGDALHAEIVVDSTDPEGDPLTYVWSWTIDGQDAGIDGPDVPAERVLRGDDWEVTLYAKDAVSESPRAVRAVTIGDAVPDPSPVEVTPADAAPGEPLTCSHVDPIDPEGDPVTLSYGWTIDGADAGVDDDVLASGAQRGQVVTCSVYVDDGRVTVFTSPEVRIGNAAPSISSVSISPTSGDRDTTFTCTAAGAADPDGDSVVLGYVWSVNGVATGTSRTFAGAFSRDDVLTCAVTPNDGYLSGATVSSAALTVGDAAPSAPTVGFTLSEIVPGVPATCAVRTDGTDADGDSVSYLWSWTVDGVAASSTSDTLSTSSLTAGQTVTCTATSTDGILSGGSGSASLVVGAVASGDTWDTDAFLTITGSSTNALFGTAVSAVQDYDGDGLGDLLVTAPRGGGSMYGAVYLYTSSQLAGGGTLTDADAAEVFYGHTNGDYLGALGGAMGAGDVDGDGVGDFVVAAPYEDTNGTDAGQAYLFYGGTAWTYGDDVLTASDARFRGDAGDWFGARMSSGDLDGDGLTDLCIASPYDAMDVYRGGVVAVFLGGGTRYNGSYDLTDADARVYGTESDAQLGWSVAVTGDGDGDGYGDLAVGIVYSDRGGTDAGQAAVISGDSLGGDDAYSSIAWRTITGTHAGDRFGHDVAAAGDVDGDGLADLQIGAYYGDDGGADSGRVALFYGTRGAVASVDDTDADAIFAGEAAGDHLGGTLASAGDWDGDGLSDLFFSASNGSGGGVATAGVGYLFLGADAAAWTTSSTAADASVRFLGSATGDYFADDVTGGFDVNGDAYDDLAIGAPGADLTATASGAVYLFEGP